MKILNQSIVFRVYRSVFRVRWIEDKRQSTFAKASVDEESQKSKVGTVEG